MTSETRSLHYEVLQILKKANVPYDPLLPIRIKTISIVNRSHTTDRAFIGMTILPGRTDVLVRPKTVLVETLRLDRNSFITTWNIVVMDAAGDLRLVEDITANDGDPSGANRFVDQVADLVEEQANLNHPPPTTDHATMNILHDAATRISHTHRSRWAGWITYILEVLQDHAEPAAYGKMLAEVGLAIAVWELEGSW